MIGYPFSCFFSQLDLEWLAGFPSGDALLWLRNASVPMEGSDICLARQNGFACWDRSKVFLWIMTVWNGFVYLFWTFVCFWIMIFGMCLYYTCFGSFVESWSVPGGNGTYIGTCERRTCSWVGVFKLEAAVNLLKYMTAKSKNMWRHFLDIFIPEVMVQIKSHRTEFSETIQ